jgi:arginine-tRNA-protein transferase
VLAVAVTDRLDDGFSAVYTFFDPGFRKRGLGIYAILYLVEQARQLGLNWCYLGYWVRGSRKMSYKEGFRPIEAKIGDRWSRFERGESISLGVRDVL